MVRLHAGLLSIVDAVVGMAPESATLSTSCSMMARALLYVHCHMAKFAVTTSRYSSTKSCKIAERATLHAHALQGRLLEAQQKLKAADQELQELQTQSNAIANQENQALGVKSRAAQEVQLLQVREGSWYACTLLQQACCTSMHYA
jgi:hypothetical protein